MEPLVVRDRRHQASGVVLLVMAGLLSLVYVFVDPAHRTDDAPGYLMIAGLTLAGLGLVVAGASSVAADERGLWVTRLLAWREIEAGPFTHLAIEGGGRRWRIGTTIAGYDGLRDALRDRRPERAPLTPYR